MPKDPEPGSSTETHTGLPRVVLRYHSILAVLARLRCRSRSTLRHGLESYPYDVARILLFPDDIGRLMDPTGVG